MSKMVKIRGLMCGAALLLGVFGANAFGDDPYSALIELDQKGKISKYLIEYLPDPADPPSPVYENGMSTWSYRVTEISGKDLSHWDVILGDCIEHYVEGSADPSNGFDEPYDGSTGYGGVLKWDVEDSFESGVFSFSLDQAYGVGMVEVLAKAGNTYNIGSIYGPDCGITIVIDDETDPGTDPNTGTAVPVPAAMPAGLALLAVLGSRRRVKSAR